MAGKMQQSARIRTSVQVSKSCAIDPAMGIDDFIHASSIARIWSKREMSAAALDLRATKRNNVWDGEAQSQNMLHHALMAPAVRPATMRRWNIRTSRTSGRVTVTDAAITLPQGNS